MNRRGFIRGLAALAALAVVPGVSTAVAKTQQELFLEEAATGLVRGKTFYLDGPVVLQGLRDLKIVDCNFFCKNVGKSALLKIDDCQGLYIMNCSFRGED